MLYQKNGVVVIQDIVSIEDRAFLYGDGCFTTARLSAGNIQLWQRHIDRLQRAIHQLRLNCDIESIKKEKQIFLEQIAQHDLESQNGVIKIVLSRGIGKRGYAMPEQACDIYFYFYPDIAEISYPTILKSVGLMHEALGTTMPSLKGIKSLNRLEQVMLKDRATEQGWNEALCHDIQGNLVEGISSNCFLYIDACWVTPDLALTGIDGIMRLEILQRMQHYQIPHQIRMIPHAEISLIQAGFFCNALYPMQMIEQLILNDDTAHVLDIVRCQTLFNTLQLKQLV